MSPHVSSPRLMPTWSPSFWVTCMFLMFGRLQALFPSEGTPLRHSEEQHGPGDTPIFPGVPSTPLTTTSISTEEKAMSSTCDIYCSLCDETPFSRVECYSEFLAYCQKTFQSEMESINATDWCMWDNVKSPYNKFTVCSEDIAECLALPWPNRLVEDMFVEIHASFFQDCPTETLRDPPPNVIFALVMTPICLIPAMVVLVVLKTKNGDRRS
ncbi:receptor activity-modifying protein 2 isoform X2 [Tachysurus vachellii]|uniref:receptor activity-modifying protein 2 isoform X2 n=1 Tax=Tachysurus vachellii TaxID=175792 RepID=UPI00296ABD98|nr:receptor activity-modifying protein 2 isoform X2 [Tachysurus vachellii]